MQLLTKTLMTHESGQTHDEEITWELLEEGHPMYDRTVEIEGQEGRFIQVSIVTLGRAQGYGLAMQSVRGEPVTDSLDEPVMEVTGEQAEAKFPDKQCDIWNPLKIPLDEGWKAEKSRGAVVIG